MQKDAEAHAEEDKKKREAIETKNNLETLIYSSEKALREAGDKVKEETKKPVQEKIDAAKEALKGDDAEKIKKANEELSAEIQKVGQELYAAAQKDEKKEEPKAEDAGKPETEEKKEEQPEDGKAEEDRNDKK